MSLLITDGILFYEFHLKNQAVSSYYYCACLPYVIKSLCRNPYFATIDLMSSSMQIRICGFHYLIVYQYPEKFL